MIIDKVIELCEDEGESEGADLLLLNCAVQIQNHSGADLSVSNINQLMQEFEKALDKLEV